MRGKLRAIIAFIVMSVALSLGGETLKKLGQWGSQDFTGMVVDGRYAYCVAQYAGLEIIDVNDRTHPVRVSGIEIPSFVAGVCSGNGYVYISAEGSLEIIDVHDPVHPTQRSRMTFGNYSGKIAWQKGCVYIIVQRGLAVVNVEDPDHPKQIALVPGSYEDFCVRNNYVYATSSTFCIINVSIPSAPFIAGSIGFENMSFGHVRLMGDHVFLSGWIYEPYDYYSEKPGGQRARNAKETSYETWFGIFNIADPTRPYKVWESNVYSGSFCVQDNYIYFSDGSVLNVSHPSQPVLVNKFDFKTDVSPLLVYRGFMYGLTENGFVIASIEQPENPIVIGSYDECGSALGVWVDEQKACLSYFYGIRMIDTANPLAPKLMWSYFEPDENVEWGMIRGTYLFLLYGKSSLYFGNSSWKIVDVSDPLHPLLVWEIPLQPEEGVRTLRFHGRYAFVTIQSGWATVVNRMEIYDVSNPSRPVLMSRTGVTGDYSRALEVSGGYAYVFTDVDNKSHLSVFDLSNPSSPTLAGSLDVNQMMLDVVISYPFAYGVGWNHAKGINELQTFDLSDPIHPLLLGNCEFGSNGFPYGNSGNSAKSICLWGHNIYVAGLDKGLGVFDVSDPLHPKEVASFITSYICYAVHGEGDRIYVSDPAAGRMYILEALDSADTNIYLSLTGVRKSDRSWILHPNYAELDIRIWNRNDRPVNRYVLSRAETGGAYAMVKEILPEEIANEMYHCRDVGLKTNMKYRYKVEALDSQGAVIAVSNEITI